MIESGMENAIGTWGAPECPYTIEYSVRALDDIRLAVVDAFFSLPRGGAEIGGVLLGKVTGNRIQVLGYEALDCEHAMGPSFTLSPRDQGLLSDLLAEARKTPGLKPVGWYHSHTRSEIFLSDADQDIHKRYFPEPWQVALVLRPHTFEPTRAGFFFREEDGSIRGSATYQEFVVESQPMTSIPSGSAPTMPPPPRPLRPEALPKGPIITIEAEATPTPEPVVIRREVLEHKPDHEPPSVVEDEPVETEIAAAATEPDMEPEPAAEPEPDPAPFALPRFAQAPPKRSWRWVTPVLATAAGLALGAVAYQTRQTWLPGLMAKGGPLVEKIRPSLPAEPAPHVSLTLAEENGQLRIHWDPQSPVVQKATEGTLFITEGTGPVRTVLLDKALLATGQFAFGREGERVDVVLTVKGDGQPVREVASFLGSKPDHKPPAEDPQVRKERDELRQEAGKLKQDLTFQAAKTRRLEKELNDLKESLARQEQRRLANQVPEATKK